MPDRNLLDELMQLLNQPGPVNWALAAQLADHLSGSPEPIDPWLAEEYLELTRFAQLQIPKATGLPSDPMIKPIIVDRSGWAEHNLRSFRYVVEPLAFKFTAAPGSSPLDALLKPLGPALLGMQMGAMVGMMSEDVLGLFDAGLPTADPLGITFLVPNIEAFATEHGLDPRQVRLWSALHEVVHESLVGRSWVRPHLVDLLRDLAASIDVDSEIMGSWHEYLADPAGLEERLSSGDGFRGLFSGSLEDHHLDGIRAFVTMVEGYGAYLIDRAATGLLTDLVSVRAAMRSCYENRTPRGFGGLFDLESAAGTYGQGATFCAEVETRWGYTAVRRVWESPLNLPSSAELNDATGWAARVLLEDPFAS